MLNPSLFEAPRPPQTANGSIRIGNGALLSAIAPGVIAD